MEDRVAITLARMGEIDFADYLGVTIPAYADDKIRSGQWAQDDALALSRSGFHDLLPQGRATPDHDLFTIRDARTDVRVGFLWIAVQARGGASIAFVYDVVVLPGHRRRGYGLRTFEALERLVAERGLAGIALHVFGHNAAARAFYERLGFVTTNLDLFKRIGQTA